MYYVTLIPVVSAPHCVSIGERTWDTEKEFEIMPFSSKTAVKRAIAALVKTGGYTPAERKDAIASAVGTYQPLTELPFDDLLQVHRWLEEASRGTKLTLMRTLPVGACFAVNNGDWDGRIVSVDGVKHLIAHDTGKRINLAQDPYYSLDITLQAPPEPTAKELTVETIRSLTQQVRTDTEAGAVPADEVRLLCDVVDSILALGSGE